MCQGGGYELFWQICQSIIPNVELPKGAALVMTPEIFCHSKVKFEKAEDLKGLKMRTAGEGGEVLKRMGVVTLFMPHEEIYEALQRGVLDMAESGGPQMDWSLAYQECSPYVYVGTLRQPTDPAYFGINKNDWAKLSDELKGIVIACARQQAMQYYMEQVLEDAKAIDKFREYGNEIIPVPDAIKTAYRDVAKAYYAEEAAKLPVMKAILDSQYAFEELYYGYVGGWD
jgi:TRAP-type mannitol/chloroaromatic compound transport system substrate-binding protein